MQAISFYLAKPPQHKVLAVELAHTATVSGLLLPIKAISDLVVVSRMDSNSLDIIDHKFVDNFSIHRENKTLFMGAGGQTFDYVSCLNDDDSWCRNLTAVIESGEHFDRL